MPTDTLRLETGPGPEGRGAPGPNRYGWPEFETSTAWEVKAGCLAIAIGEPLGSEPPPESSPLPESRRYDPATAAVRPS